MRRPSKHLCWRARQSFEPPKRYTGRQEHYSALAPESLTALAQRGISARK